MPCSSTAVVVSTVGFVIRIDETSESSSYLIDDKQLASMGLKRIKCLTVEQRKMCRTTTMSSKQEPRRASRPSWRSSRSFLFRDATS